jgi:DNA replication protein DnaD
MKKKKKGHCEPTSVFSADRAFTTDLSILDELENKIRKNKYKIMKAKYKEEVIQVEGLSFDRVQKLLELEFNYNNLIKANEKWQEDIKEEYAEGLLRIEIKDSEYGYNNTRNKTYYQGTNQRIKELVQENQLLIKRLEDEIDRTTRLKDRLTSIKEVASQC